MIVHCYVFVYRTIFLGFVECKVKTLKIFLAFPSMLLADLDLAFVFPVATTHNVYVRSFGLKTILFDAAQECLHCC